MAKDISISNLDYQAKNITNEHTKEKESSQDEKSRVEVVFGFKLEDLSSWENFVRLMNRPCHPASLAVFRVCYAILMLHDLMDERGLSSVTHRWGNRETCHFPLIHGMDPLPLQWMVLVYVIMTIGGFGILLGFMFRISCAMFAFSYWYILLLERTRWNNHSYLFGLVSVILLCSDANRYWSLDGLIWKHKRNAEVPLWNYYIPRFQLFVLYFIAGLKKFDSDWTHGYSMNLSSNWVFLPFRLFFSKDTVNMYFVHTAGHMIDLTLAYLLFFDATRPVGLIIGFAFNFMNATMFSIGMFPYMCIVTLPLFCRFDWPVNLIRKLPNRLKFLAPTDGPMQPSDHCIYTKESIESSKQLEQHSVIISVITSPTKHMRNNLRFYHKFFAVFAVLYSAEQLFLPYSHFITQGYNDWKPGMYGYSWDMMIRTWKLQHAKITYVVKNTGEIGHIFPNAFVQREYRWCMNADKIIQYAKCLEKRLAERNITNVEIYMDVWASMTKRFMQQAINSSVNILTAEWSPFKKTPWLFPLLDELTVWRDEIQRIRNATKKESKYHRISFVANFPGQTLTNYVQIEIGQVTLTVLEGILEVDVPSQHIKYTLTPGEMLHLPSEDLHIIKTVSRKPSCFYYKYVDLFKKYNQEGYKNFVSELKKDQNIKDENLLSVAQKSDDDYLTSLYKEWMANRQDRKKSNSFWKKWTQEYPDIYYTFLRSLNNIRLALRIFQSGQDQGVVQKEIERESNPESTNNNFASEKVDEYSMFYKEPLFNETSGKTIYVDSLEHSYFLKISRDPKFTEELDLKRRN